MMPPEIAEGLRQISVWVLPLLFAITLHEAAHGIAAYWLGDDTAYRQGRVSANPLHHVDPFGTVLLPGILLLAGGHFVFGYAKPVPVNFGRLRPLRLGTVIVAFAGPATNILLALISAVLIYGLFLLPLSAQEWATQNLENSINFNLVLFVFNMLPLPPLDGGRVLVAILPRDLGMALSRIEPYTMIGLMAAILILPMIGFDLFQVIIGVPVFLMKGLLLRAVGFS
jgi:Zn-dependent protease